ncbi:GIY-YIG nuclease family protein [Chryseomicrobium palamuruense]|uniref:GIY-YIG nuclease family protein n=1 Tax=Chryseomicrobium palamuruense TaxID=682973 RepID=A0ABV8UYM7_9BACL
MEMKNSHFFYVLRCQDQSFYAGYARDVMRRLEEHNAGVGCKYTRVRRPVELIHAEGFDTRSEAMKAEYAFKQLTRKQKEGYLERSQHYANTILSSI